MKKSTSFGIAETRAEVPFLYHQVLECGYEGLTHTISDHDVTITIPEGAVSKGDTVHFELGVSLYGPFRFPENVRPISPVIWLCLLEEDYDLKQTFEIHVPHFLMHLTKQRIWYHQVHFAKANHNYIEMNNKRTTYTFQQLDSQPYFVTKDDKPFAILRTKHCCFLCLEAKKSQQLTKDTKYCLVRIDCSPYKVNFLATFFLKTCLKVRLYGSIPYNGKI